MVVPPHFKQPRICALFLAALSALCVCFCSQPALSQTALTAQPAPASRPNPPGEIAPPSVPTPSLLIYRAAPSPFGKMDTISAQVYSNGKGGVVNLRLIASNGDTAVSSLSMIDAHQDSENEPLWPQWISPDVPLTYKGWRTISFPLSQLVYRAPIGASPSDPPADPATADAMGVCISDSGEGVDLDNLTWSNSASAVPPVVVDDFESGSFDNWAEHGAPEAIADAHVALESSVLSPASGRIALGVDFSAAMKARMLAKRNVLRAMALARRPYVTFVPSSTFARILPSSLPGVGELSQSIQLFAGPTQTESGSFCIYTKVPLNNVTVAPARPLTLLHSKIDPSNIDIRVVKVWETEGTGKYYDRDADCLTPELLMKDDREPLASPPGQLPLVRLTGDPQTSIPANSTKQFWVRVSVPKYTLPGRYLTPLVISGNGFKPSSVMLSVDVLPIDLYGASKQYFMGWIGLDIQPTDSTGDIDQPTEDQITATLSDVHDHGVLAAVLPGPQTSLSDEVASYKAAQMDAPLIYQGLTGDPDSDEAAADSIDSARESLGLDSVAFLTPDNATPDELATLHKAKHTTAAFITSQERFDALGDALDMPIYSIDEPYVQQLLQTSGARTSDKFDYWYWPAYDEDPQANRLYSGLLLYRANLYGAYLPDCRSAGNPFDQLPDPGASGDAAVLRHPMLMYPVQGGVLDTIQWEAVQAGVNDIRYLTTYFAALRECKDNHVARGKVAIIEPSVKQMLSKAWWLDNDTTYQNARRILAKDAIILRSALNNFYAPKPPAQPSPAKTVKAPNRHAKAIG